MVDSSGKSSFLEDGEANEERLQDMERNAGQDSYFDGGGGDCEGEGRVVIWGQR